jgi:hypothetical protein
VNLISSYRHTRIRKQLQAEIIRENQLSPAPPFENSCRLLRVDHFHFVYSPKIFPSQNFARRDSESESIVDICQPRLCGRGGRETYQASQQRQYRNRDQLSSIVERGSNTLLSGEPSKSDPRSFKSTQPISTLKDLGDPRSLTLKPPQSCHFKLILNQVARSNLLDPLMFFGGVSELQMFPCGFSSLGRD